MTNVRNPESSSFGKQILDAFPEPRMSPFLQAAEENEEEALKLYVWNVRMAGACLEQLSHVEVLLRQTIDTQMRRAINEDQVGIPWFLLSPYSEVSAKAVEHVRARLRRLNKETRDQIVAELSFGYWSGWLGSKHEELWRQTLRHGFPNGSGRRKEVAALAEQIRRFRNRIAHHDSLLTTNITFEMKNIFRLAEIINPEVADWMRKTDRTQELDQSKPIVPLNVVIVPAADAWPLYNSTHAYICQPRRFFQQVDYVAFYAERQVMKEVAKVKHRLDNVSWNPQEAAKLQQSEDKDARRLGKVMEESITAGWNGGVYQVFLLTRPDEPGHITLKAPLKNDRRGRGSAFVRKQRYTSVHKLQHATDVWSIDPTTYDDDGSRENVGRK